ncbi:MAG: hypothetical protein IKF91_04695 [Bacilli bacterium]|nr:hypothetical protein [Bacilli bacterium]
MKNVIKINKSKVKILSLKNKDVNLNNFTTIVNDLNLFEITYFISLNERLKTELFSYYENKVKEDGINYKYGDLFILVFLSISLEKYKVIKNIYDSVDTQGSKIIVSLNYSLIEYYLYFSDYNSILKLLYALSMCKKAKKYILKHTLKYLRYMTDVNDEIVTKILNNLLSYDLYFSFKVFKNVTNNLNISLKEGIFRFYKMSFEEFEDLAYKRVFENKFLLVVSELYMEKNNATIEDFYNDLDRVFEKIESYEENKDLVNDIYKFIQREFFLFIIIINNFSKYEKYKNDLFGILKNDIFRSSYVYHNIDSIDNLAIRNNKIIELLDNMPDNIYGYSEDMTNIIDTYKYFRHDYLKDIYKDIFNYLKQYTSNEIIRIYMNTSMKLIIDFEDMIKFLRDNYNDVRFDNYYFYGSVRKDYMNKYQLRITNVLFDKKIDITDNAIINNLHSYYLDNKLRIRFKMDYNYKISDISYISKDGSIISFYDRYKDVYNYALLGKVEKHHLLYINNSNYQNLTSDIYKIHLEGILNIDENNYKEVLLVLENDNISGFKYDNYDIDINYCQKKYAYSEDALKNKWIDILKMDFDSNFKFKIYISSAFKIFIKLEDVISDLKIKEIPDYKSFFFVGISNEKVNFLNCYSKVNIVCEYKGKIKFQIKNSSFNLINVINIDEELTGLDIINRSLDNYFIDKSIKNYELNLDDLFCEPFDDRYMKHLDYLEKLCKIFSNIDDKNELLLFINNIGKGNIFNEKYPIYYSIYKTISNFNFNYKKFYDVSFDEAIKIYMNSPLKYLYFISDYLKDYFKMNRANTSLVLLSPYHLIMDGFILENGEFSTVEFNDKEVDVYIEDAPSFGFAKIEITKYEVFTGKLYGKLLSSVVDKTDVKKLYMESFDKMKNFKIGDDKNSFNYLNSYKASVYNINDYLIEYINIFTKNFRDIDFEYDFLNKNDSFNIFNNNFDSCDIKNNYIVRRYKEKLDGFFRFGEYSQSILKKKLYVSENSFIKNPLRRLIRCYCRFMKKDNYVFENGKRLKLKIKEIGEYVICMDEYRNYYPLKFDINYNFKEDSYIIVSLSKYYFEGNYFVASLISKSNIKNDYERRFALYINDILNILSGILYDDGDNYCHYLISLSKYSNLDVDYLMTGYKKKEFFDLYFRIFKKYVSNFDKLNKFLNSMDKLNPFNLFNYFYKTPYISRDEIENLTSEYVKNVIKTEYYLDALNIYYNSFVPKIIKLDYLKVLFDRNHVPKFNKYRNSKTLFVKYKIDDLYYLRSYCGRLKIPVVNFRGIEPYMRFCLRKCNIKDFKIDVNNINSYDDIKEVEKYKPKK